MRFRLRSLLIVLAVGPIILAALLLTFTSYFERSRFERPPAPMQPKDDTEREILALVDQSLLKTSFEIMIPIRIENSPRNDGRFMVVYWTPSKEYRLLGSRAVLVDPRTRTVEWVMRD